MATSVKYSKREGYLLVEVSGDWSTDDAERVITEIYEKAKDAGLYRVLLDRRNLAETPRSEFARFVAGETVSRLMPPPFRFAAVYPNENIDRFGETAAVNRGASVAIFSNMADAISWLTSEYNVVDTSES